jgi:hypothetical protein
MRKVSVKASMRPDMGGAAIAVYYRIVPGVSAVDRSVACETRWIEERALLARVIST